MSEPSTRVDSWLWAVRVFKTRSQSASACRGGHVKVNGVPAKPAQHVAVGDEVRVRAHQRDRILEVRRILSKRVSAELAATALIDLSPPPPPKELLTAVPIRDRGAGRPTKRERRQTDALRGRLEQ